MKIKKVLCSAGKTGFFFDDQMAIKNGAVSDGANYSGNTVTPGFNRIRVAGESVSIMLVLDDGQIAYGDCAAVQYSGAGGRDPLFLAEQYIPAILAKVVPVLEGADITSFREMAKAVDSLTDENGKLLHTAIRYGATQAVLDAVAKSKGKLMAQIVADEYGLTISDKRINIFSQSGDDRYNNADKMILKNADALPHALINTAEKLGHKGEALKKYVTWLSSRIDQIKVRDNYSPSIHLDLYGMLGIAFGGDLGAIADYIEELSIIAGKYPLLIEGPIDMGERNLHIEKLAELTRIIDERGIKCKLVADEWCNTLEDVIEFADKRSGHMIQIKTPDLGGINNSIEAVIYCKNAGVEAYLGGTCNETDRSAAICAHVAMATSPVQVLAKPGMGVDEGHMIAYNEMQRILALKDVL